MKELILLCSIRHRSPVHHGGQCRNRRWYECCLLVDMQSMGTNPAFRRLLVVVKQTAYEEYSQASCRHPPVITTELGDLRPHALCSLIAFHIFFSSSVHEVKHPKLYDGNVLNLATRHISNASTISWIYCVGMTFHSRVLIEWSWIDNISPM